MPDTVIRVHTILATSGPPGAWQSLEVALAAAMDAGRRAIAANPRLPPAEQLAVALQAADEALEGLAMELAGWGAGGRG